MVPMSSVPNKSLPSFVSGRHEMGTALLANSTIKLSFAWNAFYFWGTWAVCIIGLGIVLWAALRSKRWTRWTTQHILIGAALGLVLDVYDNSTDDQSLNLNLH